MEINVKRRDVLFKPDSSRVIARFLYTNDERSRTIISRVLQLNEKEAKEKLNQVLRKFSKRHRSISNIFNRHFLLLDGLMKEMEINPLELSVTQKALIGSYFTKEYSVESAAFFNPSIMESPDQTGVMPDAKRVNLSFRATGEGHISSIVFRTGILDKDSNLTLEPLGNMPAESERIKRFIYDKKIFLDKLNEMQLIYSIVPTEEILECLDERFTYGELESCVREAIKRNKFPLEIEEAFNQIMWLASSDYEIDFSMDSAISERVIFPISSTERNGIEDARFVRFIDDDGQVIYYATYTAYNGMSIMPKLIETKDFYLFKVLPLHGHIAKNKGMALFPRKIDGKYAMLCRMDGCNNYISYSENINAWNEAFLFQSPHYPWEFVKIGNCGSPLETREGWLIITHAVGPMREYVLGAVLMDLDHPEIEIGRLKAPLLAPNEQEREGYVPNVVYSCGSMIHNDDLIIPYAVSDYASTYATVNLEELLSELKKNKIKPQ
ncbi:MAG: glycoside hydrolase family 130 protein [Spirochaetaceae bacterium]|nr:glycoside hydrolase family 130 protein [Spirochaetaceae bacterium]